MGGLDNSPFGLVGDLCGTGERSRTEVEGEKKRTLIWYEM
jgi:hypothetical protein